MRFEGRTAVIADIDVNMAERAAAELVSAGGRLPAELLIRVAHQARLHLGIWVGSGQLGRIADGDRGLRRGVDRGAVRQ